MTGMKEKYDIKSITEKYIKGKCTPEELEEAIILFADPYHNPELRPTLFEYWIKDEKSGADEIPAEDLSNILDKVHHRINLKQDQKAQTGLRS
jgi:hypothetical protein